MDVNEQKAAVEALKSMDTMTVGPELIAKALKMSPGVLREHVRRGEYKISAVDVCGGRIRFFRKDFLRKIGEFQEDELEKLQKTDSDRLDEIIELIRVQNTMLMEMLAYVKLCRKESIE